MFTLFRNKSDSFIIASPRFLLVFWKVYSQTLLSSIWPLIVILIPAFLGSNVVSPIGGWGSIIFLFSVLFLAGLGVSLALILFLAESLILYIISRITSWKKLFSFGSTVTFGIVTVIGIMIYAWHRVGHRRYNCHFCSTRQCMVHFTRGYYFVEV